MEYLLSLVVVRTVQLSEWTSTKARNLRCVPAIEVLRLSQVCLCHRASALPARFSHKKGVFPPTHWGRNTPVVVKGKCQGLMFSDSVSSYSLSDHKGSFVPFSGH